MSGAYGAYAERTMNPIARMGAMDAHANFDNLARIAIESDNGRNGVSLYDGASDPQVWTIAERAVCFTVNSNANPKASNQFLVLDAINGLGATATKAYPNDPEMVRLAVRNAINYAGVSILGVEAKRGKQEVGVALALAGLNTLYQGAGMGPNIRPGDTVVVDVPVPGMNRQGIADAGFRGTPGQPGRKYTLQARALTPVHPARALQKHMIEAVRNPTRYRAAMGLRYRSTDAWLTVVRRVFDSHLTTMLLGVAKLTAKGHLLPGPELLRHMEPAQARTIILGMQARFANVDAATVDVAGALALDGRAAIDADAAAARAAGVTTATHLTEFLGLSRTNKFSARMQVADINRFKLLTAELAHTWFTDGKNAAHQFGFAPAANGRPAEHPGRHRISGKINTTDPAGCLLAAQLNHLTQEASALYAAYQDETRMIIGKAITGASNEGSNRFHVALGISHA